MRRFLQFTCLLCRQAAWQHIVCDDCRSQLPYLDSGCPVCANPLTTTDKQTRCGQCISKPPAFDCVIAPFSYEPPLVQLINQYKFNQHLHLRRLFCELMTPKLIQHYQQHRKPDLITAIPLHWRRLWLRGFNQSWQLAKLLSKQLHIPAQLTGKRAHHQIAQAKLKRKERKKNLAKAFKIANPHKVSGKHIAVVDDVITTGTTAHHYAKLLKKSGATQVDIWVITKTVLH